MHAFTHTYLLTHTHTVGYSLVTVNGQPVTSRCLPNGENVLKFLQNPSNFPVRLKFTRLKASVNERIMLLSMFHSIYAISVKLSPEKQSSGIQCLEADTFKLHCFQTVTGVKFILVSDHKLNKAEELLNEIYKLYSDYVLKNPFYSVDMPIRCEQFNTNLAKLLDSLEKSAYLGLTGGSV